MSRAYRTFVQRHARLLEQGKALPLGGLSSARRPRVKAGAGRVAMFSPHPDDECIVGALPLRLLRELRMEVINISVTQGSRKERQAARWKELEGACQYLGFRPQATAPNGLLNVNPDTRQRDPQSWAVSVNILVDALHDLLPSVVVIPHERDGHPTHMGTHWLVRDALSHLDPEFVCVVVETEYWHPMTAPNLMVESTVRDVADLVAALSFHHAEVQRSPYHLRLPAWMIDNVRRGSELLAGPGAPSADFTFATLYRVRHWRGGALQPPLAGMHVVPATASLEPLFGKSLG
jgi:LmbE family N-acetylglucosaminyl deacetylase